LKPHPKNSFVKTLDEPSDLKGFCKYPPGLYLVATPIGNLEDITLRALTTLKSADFIVCEDTRVSQKLLTHYGIKAKLQAYHDHNAEKVRPKIIEGLKDNKTIALISDAGMPLISDPGYKLVRAVVEEGLYVTVVPGPSSVLAALCLSGLNPLPFTFCGFIPAKEQQRKSFLESFKDLTHTLIFFDTPQRLVDTLDAIQEVMGERRVAVARELTKKFEEVLRGSVSFLQEALQNQAPLKGEIVLLVEGQSINPLSEQDLEDLLKELLAQGKSGKEAVSEVQAKTQQPRQKIYKIMLRLKDTLR
jgi:16S rRNA (cytidine1402-2'-O)-methyltransferase